MSENYVIIFIKITLLKTKHYVQPIIIDFFQPWQQLD